MEWKRTDHVNDNVLRCIAYQTAGHFGKTNVATARMIASVEEDFVVTNLKPALGDDDEADLSELLLDESFVTVPDWRTTSTWWPVQKNGALITGTLPISSSSRPVALEVSITSTKSLETRLFVVPFSVPSSDSSSSSSSSEYSGEIGRLVGLTHCKQVIEEARQFRLDAEFAKSFIEEVALKYNIASDHTTLLLLHSAQQFIDNGIACPESHPEHKAWQELKSKIVSNDRIEELSKKLQELEKQRRIMSLGRKLFNFNRTGRSREERAAQAARDVVTSINAQISSAWESAQRQARSLLQDSSRQLESRLGEIKAEVRSFEQRRTRALGMFKSGDDEQLKQQLESRAREQQEEVTTVEQEVARAKERLDQEWQEFLSVQAKLSSDQMAAVSKSAEPHMPCLEETLRAIEKARADEEARISADERALETHLNEVRSELAEARRAAAEAAAEAARRAAAAAAATSSSSKKKSASSSNDNDKGDTNEQEQAMQPDIQSNIQLESCLSAECEESAPIARRQSSMAPSSDCDSMAMPCPPPSASPSVCAPPPVFSQSSSVCAPSPVFSQSVPCSAPRVSSSMSFKKEKKMRSDVRESRSMRECEETLIGRPNIVIAPPTFAEVANEALAGSITSTASLRSNIESVLAAASNWKQAVEQAVQVSNSATQGIDDRIKRAVESVPGTKSGAYFENERAEMNRRQERAGKLEKAMSDAGAQGYLRAIHDKLQQSRLNEEERVRQAYEAYLEQRKLGSNSSSPSFYLYCSRLFYAVRRRRRRRSSSSSIIDAERTRERERERERETERTRGEK